MHEFSEPRVNPNAHFLAGDVPHSEAQRGRFGSGMALSALSHVGVVLVFVLIARWMPEPARVEGKVDDIPSDIVWLNAPGPGGGGGGGGNRSPAPPRKVELPGTAKVTVPAAKPRNIAPEPPKDVPKPEPQITIPAVTTSAGVQQVPGALAGLPSVPSQGTGTGGGAGTGAGSGIGAGRGSGLGPGYGGGTGGGVYRPGNDVSWPRLLYEKKPNYTSEAMRAKVQGIVEVEALVLPDGSVADVKVTRSLDPTFGLDREALIAVRQWKFTPAVRRGQAVPVLVPIEVSFTLR